MRESHENAQGRSENHQSIDEIKDYDALALRELFSENELVQAGDIISADDYEAIKSRAEVLLKNSTKPLSAHAALLAACADRLQLKEKIGMEVLKNMSENSLRAIFYAETGIMFTDEELVLFKSSPLSVDDWLVGRQEMRSELH